QRADLTGDAGKPTSAGSEAHLDWNTGRLICGLRARAIPALKESPDLDFQFQVDAVLFGHFRLNEVNQAQHVCGGGPFIRDNEIAVAITDFTLPHAGAFESGLLDERACAEASWIFEHATGRLERERLRGLLHDPQLAHPSGDFIGILASELELGIDD